MSHKEALFFEMLCATVTLFAFFGVFGSFLSGNFNAMGWCIASTFIFGILTGIFSNIAFDTGTPQYRREIRERVKRDEEMRKRNPDKESYSTPYVSDSDNHR